MSAVAYADTVPAHPLGIPVDGRKRYGMTAEQAHIYRWLVRHLPHDSEFKINFQRLGDAMVCKRWNAFTRVQSLVERGWIAPTGSGRYAFVHPVKMFREPRA